MTFNLIYEGSRSDEGRGEQNIRVTSWSLQLGSLWGSEPGVYCRIYIVTLET